MDALMNFVTSMLALSVGVERIVEILKDMAPKLAGRASPLVVRLITVAVGAAVVWVVDPASFLGSAAASTPAQKLGCAVLLGFVAAGGAGFWNHALDILRAIKTVQESKASALLPTNASKGNP